MSTYDLIALHGGRNHPMSSKDQYLEFDFDFAEHNVGNAETADWFVIPAGFVRVDQDVILLTAEGGAGTIDIGYSGATDKLLDGGNVNGTANAVIAKGTNAAAATTVHASATTVTITANAALDAAKIKIIVRGYMTNVRS